MATAQPRLHPQGVEILGPVSEAFAEILTPEALSFLAKLSRTFDARRKALLQARSERQQRFDAGELPHFLEETASIRSGDWTLPEVPPDLRDRRVEITGPASDRKMVINALNSGATTYMTDFEDANAPTWDNVIGGQINVRDAVRKTISYVSPEGKRYALKEKIATLIVRPRGLHLPEKHIRIDGEPMGGALVDFGLFFYHNAKALLDQGSGPYLYLPKLEHYTEAAWWDEVFTFAENELGLPHGVCKATVLIETFPAAFQMHEILYALRDHAAGLNCGRWDYIFSYIKTRKRHPDVILPDRASVTMTVPFMRAYTQLAIQTCHRRNIHCIGGMAAQIPVKEDPQENEMAFAKVREDKEREARDGHDGTWVAHPGLVPVALEVFNRLMPTPNQIDKKREDVHVTEADLAAIPQGAITEAGVRNNISVAIQYIGSWLNGHGAVPIFHLMEDAATAEIARTQLWQWMHHPKGVLQDGRKVDEALFQTLLAEELEQLLHDKGTELAQGRHEQAAEILKELTLSESLPDFFTLRMYDALD